MRHGYSNSPPVKQAIQVILIRGLYPKCEFLGLLGRLVQAILQAPQLINGPYFATISAHRPPDTHDLELGILMAGRISQFIGR